MPEPMTDCERAVVDAAMALMDARGEKRQMEAWHRLKDASAALKRERILASYHWLIAMLMAMPEEDIDKLRRDAATDEVIEKLVAMTNEERQAMFAAYRAAGDPVGIKLAEVWEQAVNERRNDGATM